MLFQKQDLEGTHYRWDEQTEQVFRGQPSRRVFDRNNGNQVLFLINFYGSLSGRFSIQEGKNIERKIQQHLPADAVSEISVFNWIRNNDRLG